MSRLFALLLSALCVRGQGIDWEAVDRLNAETGGSHYIQLQDPVIAAAAPPGYSALVSLVNQAISVPTCGSADTYLGVRISTSGQFNTTWCTDVCDTVNGCQFINTYNLRQNGNVMGQFCALYTRAWDVSYGYNLGQYRGNDLYTISDSYISFKGRLPLPATCPDEECKREIFSCFRSSPQARDYCSALTPYTTTVASTTPSATATTSTTYVAATMAVTATSTSTVTQTVPSTTTMTGYYSDPPSQQKRAPSTSTVATPGCIATQSFPPDRITSACSCLGVPARTVSVTSTAPTATVTSTASVPSTTAATVATVWQTTTTTATSVRTVWVPAPTPANQNFEQGTQQTTWVWSASDVGWTLGLVQTPDPDGNPTWAFNAASAQNTRGVAAIDTAFEHRFLLRAGPTYRVSLDVKTTALNLNRNIATDILFLSSTADGHFCGGPWDPLTNGVALGNGWHRYTMDFVVPQAQQGYCDAYTLFRTQGIPGNHFVDNYSIVRL
ncbi:hypothetical protein PG988_003661 [Apiospora saccharicola]